MSTNSQDILRATNQLQDGRSLNSRQRINCKKVFTQTILALQVELQLQNIATFLSLFLFTPAFICKFSLSFITLRLFLSLLFSILLILLPTFVNQVAMLNHCFTLYIIFVCVQFSHENSIMSIVISSL